MHSLKYPIGSYKRPEHIDLPEVAEWITDISQFPEKLAALTSSLRNDQLKWPYRPGGWTIHQVVHHCADSHMNSFIRFKLAMTEENPTIKPYLEHLWAEMPDTLDANISHSLAMLEGLHQRWVILLKNLKPEDLERKFIHPEHGKRFTLGETIALYAWHSNHHLAHVEQAIKYKGNFGKDEGRLFA
jgi:hypothetical protein